MKERISVTAQQSPWWMAPRPRRHGAVKLICFPYAGGNASMFYGWHRCLPKEIEVCAVQLPGRAARIREEPITRFVPLVRELASALRPLLTGRFAFFGHSMGALLSFELARWLAAQRQQPPECLFVSACPAPDQINTSPLSLQGSDQDLLKEVMELGGTPYDVESNPELLDVFLPVLRSDCKLLASYEFKAGDRLSCPIVAFGGTCDKEASGLQLRGWQDRTDGGFSLHIFDGGHFFINEHECDVLRLISSYLDQGQ